MSDPNREQLNNLQRDLEKISLSVLVLKADVQALLDILTALYQKAGIVQIDGLDIGTIFARQHVASLQKTLIEIEDKHPALAARLQQLLDQAKSNSIRNL